MAMQPTSAQKTNNSLNQTLTGFEPKTLTCLCYTISSPMLKKKSKIRCYIKNQKNRTNSVKSLPEKIMKRKIINRSFMF